MSRKRANEERNEAKVSRSVLESSGSRKGVTDFNIALARSLAQAALLERGAARVPRMPKPLGQR